MLNLTERKMLDPRGQRDARSPSRVHRTAGTGSSSGVCFASKIRTGLSVTAVLAVVGLLPMWLLGSSERGIVVKEMLLLGDTHSRTETHAEERTGTVGVTNATARHRPSLNATSRNRTVHTPRHTPRVLLHMRFGPRGDPVIPADAPSIVIIASGWEEHDPLVGLEAKSFTISLLRWEKGPLRYFIVTSANEVDEMRAWFSTACHQRKSALEVSFIGWDPEHVRAGVKGFGLTNDTKGPLEHHSGVYGSLKIFLADILPSSVTRVIYYDVDIVLNRAISDLWTAFDQHVPEGTLFSATEFTAPARDGLKNHTSLCSCLLLLRLDRMRDVGWVAGSEWLHRQVQNTTFFDPGRSGHGDQALFEWVRLTSPALYGNSVDWHWVGSWCQTPEQGGSKLTNPLSPPGMVPRSGSEEWTALHFNCWSPRRWEAEQVGLIRAYYLSLANTSNVDVCKA